MPSSSPRLLDPSEAIAVPGDTPRDGSLSPERSPLRWLYLDRRGSLSKPKFLFTVVALDILVVAVAGLLAATVVGGARTMPLALPAAAAVLLAAALHRQWSYSIHALRNLTEQTVKVLSASCIVFTALSGVVFLSASTAPTAPIMLAWFGLSSLLLVMLRVAEHRVICALTSAGRLLRRTVIVGGGREADDLIKALADDKDAHLDVIGVFDDRQGERSVLAQGAKQLSGTFSDLEAFCLKEGIELAIVTVPPRAEERLLQVLEKLFTLPVDIRVSAHASRLRLSRGAYSYIGTLPMLAVMDKPLGDWDRVVKNIEDRVLAVALLFLFAPIMAGVALAVRMTSKGPILFKQRRYGFNNELVEVYKFRSMFTDQSDAAADKLVTRGDARVTPVGRFIRRTSLDELPQLLNVIKGDMSLVGPRPHATRAKAGDDLYENVVHGYFARHRVKPGVTGWAQINGWRGETDTSEKIERRVAFDLEYIDRWSLPFDLYIIAMTPIALLSGKNAY